MPPVRLSVRPGVRARSSRATSKQRELPFTVKITVGNQTHPHREPTHATHPASPVLGESRCSCPLMPGLAAMGRVPWFVLIALAIKPLSISSQLLEIFPVDRYECASDNNPCTVGTYFMSADFPVRVTEYTSPPMGEIGVLNPLVDAAYTLTEGYEIDFTGGLTIPPAEYVAPTAYRNTAGMTAFVDMEVTISINDTHFTPENVSVLPGTTVTWVLNTFETVNVRSEDGGAAINSGPINRNWSPTFKVTFTEEAVHEYRNAEIEEWHGTFKARVRVENYNCSSYITCSTCLAYDQCIWCSGNSSCIERDPTSNLPLDTNNVVKIPHIDGREYQSIKFMVGYNIRTAQMEIDWYPWPPYRNNPRAVQASEVPSYFDPTSSDQCYAYMRTRDASQCEDYATPPPKNRVAGIETPGRPTLEDFFKCYHHLSTSWTKPDLAPPTAWEAWPPSPPSSAPLATESGKLQAAATWENFCCELCSSCSAAVLASCNVTCHGMTGTDTGASVIDSVFAGACPGSSTRVSAISSACATHFQNRSCSHTLSNATQCDHLLAHDMLPRGEQFSSHRATNTPEGGGRRRQLQLSNESVEHGFDGYDADEFEEILLETVYRPLVDGAGEAMVKVPVTDAGMLPMPAGRRRTQVFGLEVGGELTEFKQIPLEQRQLMGPAIPNMDEWTQIGMVLESLYGPRCNATSNCDLLRGSCLNISGLPVYAYDQNGTCTCHQWFTGTNCSEVLVNEVTCAMIPDAENCRSIRTRLYFCGPVLAEDPLPEVCRAQGLSVVECGEAGHMRGRRNETGTPNLLGRPEAGYASVACAKCLARGDVYSETYAKVCDPAVTLRMCQRQEDAFAQRLCNYCGVDTQGSVLPQRGEDRSCSFYRGTCMGSVEKRIRGIVPPNLDILGQTSLGGLRYCKQPSTFTSTQHYYSDDDILQAGQTCLEGTTPTFETWDFTRQYDHPSTVRDKYSLGCLDPDNEVTCPKARHCVDNVDCYQNTPDWMQMDQLIEHWGLEKLKRYSDQLQNEEPCNYYIPQGATEDEGAAIVAQMSTPGFLGFDNDGVGVRPIQCTFQRHSLVLNSKTAYQHMSWPFLSDEYMQRYSVVDWSLDANAVPPPPPLFSDG